MFLFAYIVHTPHESVGRYVDTSTFVVGGPAGKLITLLWGYQNYHSIHHLGIRGLRSRRWICEGH